LHEHLARGCASVPQTLRMGIDTARVSTKKKLSKRPRKDPWKLFGFGASIAWTKAETAQTNGSAKYILSSCSLIGAQALGQTVSTEYGQSKQVVDHWSM
jgi:hypothetical protein